MKQLALHKPDTKWAMAFENFRQALSTNTDGLILAIEHIGSTSIDDLPAKDIVDVQCAVTDFETIDAIGEILESMGFHYLKTIRQDHVPFHEADFFHPDWEKRFFKGVFDDQVFNIHIRKFQSKNWQFALTFRDNLRRNSQLRTAYLQCKERLINAGVGLEDYCSIKDSFIDLMSLQFID
ncbi:GrpB family protein [Legionella sp. W05-934-2]|jgi:dephospho-CoA kinase|uniref:GrpB family protein n=1 Tax=Legionella sp. W05-934-2 TaxID=1198649 RepID=UPI003462657F